MKFIHIFYSTRKHCLGFTITEVIIAMAILSIALMALISVTASVVKGNQFNKMMTTATTLAKDQIEALKNTQYTDISSSSGYPGWQSVTGLTGFEKRWQVTVERGNTSCTGSGSPFTCCTGSTAGTCPGQKKIDMDVRWQWQGASRQVTLNTIVVP